MNYEEIERRLGYKFKDRRLLRRSLTLASANLAENNQTLEFFGDAILEFLVSERIFDEKSDEGELTERRKLLVSDNALRPVSLRLGLDEFFIKSPADNVLKKSVPSAYEAVLAAIYLDGGLERARDFVMRTLDFNAPRADAENAVNFKGKLQEYLQGRGEPLPEYVSVSTGSDIKPQFEVSITLYGKRYSASAGTKKQAEQLAAKEAFFDIEQNGKR